MLLRTVTTIGATLLLMGAIPVVRVAEARSDEVFRKKLSAQTDIVVTREAAANLERLKPLLPAPLAAQVQDAHVIALELRSNTDPVVHLASRLQFQLDGVSRGFDVLDVLTSPGALVVIMTAGTELQLWRINFDSLVSSDSVATLQGWEDQALASSLERKSVRVEVSTMEDGRMRAAVTDLRISRPNPPTVFEQQGKDWRFKITYRPKYP